MASHSRSLRERQIGTLFSRSLTQLSMDQTDYVTAAIERILNLNHETPDPSGAHQDAVGTTGLISHSTPILNEDGDPIWKVLVFDNLGRDVISSVLRVNDLRSWGVTIHLYAPKTRYHSSS